ncbi:MAG: hypothetical protein ABI718_17665 [Acidobacteriota bacterium]
MVHIRCTERLRKRLRLAPLPKVPSQGLLLSEWHANVITVDKFPLVLAVEDRTRLSLVVRARDLPRLPQRLASALHDLLIRLGVAEEMALGYAARMTELTWSASTDRSVLGTMNDFASLLKWLGAQGSRPSLEDMMDYLADVPTGPIGMDSPGQFTVAAIRFDPKAN